MHIHFCSFIHSHIHSFIDSHIDLFIPLIMHAFNYWILIWFIYLLLFVYSFIHFIYLLLFFIYFLYLQYINDTVKYFINVIFIKLLFCWEAHRYRSKCQWMCRSEKCNNKRVCETCFCLCAVRHVCPSLKPVWEATRVLFHSDGHTSSTSSPLNVDMQEN